MLFDHIQEPSWARPSKPVVTIKTSPVIRTCVNAWCENRSDWGAFGTFETHDAVRGIMLHMCSPCLTALSRVLEVECS